MIDTKDKYTWAELKVFVNSLPDSVLSEEVVWWGDEVGDPMEPLSACSKEYEEYITHRMPQGTPIIETY